MGLTDIEKKANALAKAIGEMALGDQVDALNQARLILHKGGPFAAEPVDFVQWVPFDGIAANDYNPNTVAPPEMKLLEHSIGEDGYTQPIVAWDKDGAFEVVDGFHRHRVGRECVEVRERIKGYLPLSVINAEREDRGDRIASTIRHNRARGKHQVAAMSDIVVELKRRNWSDGRIGKELGMDSDEVLRLTQVNGLAEMFADQDFSEAWEPEGSVMTQAEAAEVVSLEWDAIPQVEIPEPGWADRTEKNSVLFAENAQRQGMIQKSRFDETWHWRAYTQPLQSGKAETREEAKAGVVAALGVDG